MEPLHDTRTGPPPAVVRSRPKSEPTLLGQFPLRDSYEGAESCFCCQQIIETCIPPPVTDVVSDSQQIAPLIKQKIVFYLGEITALLCQPFDIRHQCSGAPAGIGKESAKFAKLHMLVGRYISGHLLLDGR